MKKLSLYVFLVLMFYNVGLAKEFKSKLGFYFEPPFTWKVADNQNLMELIEKSDYDFDKESIIEILQLLDNNNYVYVYPISYNFKLNNVNIHVAPMEEGALSESDMPDFCGLILVTFRITLNSPTLKQHECKLSKLIPKFHNVIELKHDGPVKGMYNIQFFFDDRSNAKSLTVTLGCEFDNCEILKKETIKIINSIRF